jgi:TolB-like protein/class 3 adenylate cyclase
MGRRLAAVLLADVVGYSRLMEADEAGTLTALKQRRREILEPVVRDHGGRVVKVMGDGVLVEFGSAVSAIAAALELQRRMAAANEPLPEHQRIVLRIGVNLGDVIGEGGDIYGEGVNIAARLEGLAEPGGICISANLFDEVHGKVAAQTVKNIRRPVHAYGVRAADRIDEAALARPLPALPDKPSIAVLPFQNMSGDAEQEYFADGIVEDITTEIARLPWLFVIARNSAFTYKGRAVDVKAVGRELGVRYVLEGSVRKAGGRVRITGQLIEAATGTHLWADRFDGDLADIFDLQDRVTASVVGVIAPRLEQAEIERARRKPTGSLDAYDNYLRGMAAFYRFTPAANVEALALFERAVALDPEYGAAYGMAARCYLQRKGFGWVVDHNEEIAETRRLARRASDLGRDDAAALANAGISLIIVAGDLDDGAELIDRALALNQNLAWVWLFASSTKAYLGEAELAIEYAGRAMRLSPLDPQMFAMQWSMALGYLLLGRYDEASSWAETALRQRPNFFLASCVAAASAGLAGRKAEAARAMARLREFNPALTLGNLHELLPFRRPEDFARWAEGLRLAGLPE